MGRGLLVSLLQTPILYELQIKYDGMYRLLQFSLSGYTLRASCQKPSIEPIRLCRVTIICNWFFYFIFYFFIISLYHPKFHEFDYIPINSKFTDEPNPSITIIIILCSMSFESLTYENYENVCFVSQNCLPDAFPAQFFLAGVAALIVLISHADQMNDVIFGNEGALKGLQEASPHNV